MAHIRNIRHFAAVLACGSLGVLAGPMAPLRGAGATGRSLLAPFPAANVNFVGYGDGPGLGMGQWGAFGYAVLSHEPYTWILAHYYGGTSLSSGDSLVASNPMVSVDINENDGHPVVVTSTSAFSFGGIPFAAGQAARAAFSPLGWTLSQAANCAATKWVTVASQLVNPVAEPLSLQPSAPASQVLTICEQGGALLPVRGTVEAYAAPKGPVTLNRLPLEEYVRGVISGEVSWSWGLFGGSNGSPQQEPWGFQALEAQAVATRSYVAAELSLGGWRPYAITCDIYCQSYEGMASETPDLNAAVVDTAGQILEQPTVPGPAKTAGSARFVQPPPGVSPHGGAGYVPVLTEYSASTGGYTDGGPFPGVVDRWDSICIKSQFYTCNPCHKWSASVPVRAIEKAFKSLGALAAVEITQRNGIGALGGRVESVALVGTTGVDLMIAAYQLGPLLAVNNPYHCSSDWYGVTNGP